MKLFSRAQVAAVISSLGLCLAAHAQQEIRIGVIYPLTGPGLGTELLPEVPSRPDAVVRASQLD